MATFGTPERDDVVATDASTAHVNPVTVAAAIGLWVVVGALLTWGVIQTFIKASALFTG